MWASLQEKVALERRQLHQLLDTYRPLLDRSASGPPSNIELAALAAMLHSFYNGMENIFKRTTLELGDPMPGSEFWHKELLDSMTQATGNRKPVLSPGLQGRLKEYMEFRHMFRHAYMFNLNWDRMKSLVLDCEDTLQLVEAELDRFFEAGNASPR